MDKIRIADGFRGQIFHVIPPPLIEREHPLLQPLRITSIGWFPHARHHFIERPRGADGNVLILCARGAGWHETGGRRARLTRGQALLIPQGLPHAYGADEKDPWSIHWIHFTGDEATYYVRLLPDHQYRLPVAPDCLRMMTLVFRSGYSAIGESYNTTNITYLAQLCHHLLGLLFHNNRAYAARLRAPASHDVQPTLAYILDHCTEPLTRDDLARHAGLSPAHFSLLFKRQTGLSPMQFLAQQRMRKACQWMDTTSLTIREIALKVGYEDPYYFSRLFSKTVGHSPRHYRRLFKG